MATRLSKQQALASLQRALAQVDAIKRGPPSSPAFDKWQRDTEVAIRHAFGDVSAHVLEFTGIPFTSYTPQYLTSTTSFVPADTRADTAAFARGMERARTLLRSMIDEIREHWPDEAAPAAPPVEAAREAATAPHKKVFLVHGHNHGLKETVARFLWKAGLDFTILHEQPDQGRTIIEKFQDYADEAGYAIALFTPDDAGVNAKAPKRARQNVVFEYGFFVGKLGRKRACALVAPGVEIPSDLSGVLYIPVDDDGHWRLRLAQELKAAGLDIDFNRALA